MAEVEESREWPIRPQMTFRPVPDPTELTNRAVDSAKEELRRELLAQVAILDARMGGYEGGARSRQEAIERLPERIATEVAHLQSVLEQRFHTQDAKFDAVHDQFRMLDKRTEHDRTAGKEALALALQSAKEAVTAEFQAAREVIQTQNHAFTQAVLKSETSTDKRIDEAIRATHAATNALDARITVLADASKNIMTRQEVEQLFRGVMDKLDGPTGLAMRFESLVARTSGRDEKNRENTGQNQWIIGAVLGALGVGVAIVAALMRGG